MSARKIKEAPTPLLGELEVFTNNIPSRYPHSPLRYPGGKSRAIREILPMIPEDTTVLCSPFLGGASIELACTVKGIRVKGYDIFEPLIDFWQCLLDTPNKLANQVEKYHPLDRKQFYALQKHYTTIKDTLVRAAVFYVLNRSSFSGVTLSGGMSTGHPRFTQSSIERLREFTAHNFLVAKADYRLSIAENQDAFLYLDPPYRNGQKLYGIKGDAHQSFDHKTLRELLNQRNSWILSYNDCPTIRKWYKDYRILKANWQYGMGSHKKSNEIIIISHDLRIAA
ncbi:DNA adenine methylase [Spirochaetota bacterium]|nr:DNA adenine methylase [Spirochaetota bacterium]